MVLQIGDRGELGGGFLFMGTHPEKFGNGNFDLWMGSFERCATANGWERHENYTNCLLISQVLQRSVLPCLPLPKRSGNNFESPHHSHSVSVS